MPLIRPRNESAIALRGAVEAHTHREAAGPDQRASVLVDRCSLRGAGAKIVAIRHGVPVFVGVGNPAPTHARLELLRIPRAQVPAARESVPIDVVSAR
jgi:hypothetical protein